MLTTYTDVVQTHTVFITVRQTHTRACPVPLVAPLLEVSVKTLQRTPHSYNHRECSTLRIPLCTALYDRPNEPLYEYVPPKHTYYFLLIATQLTMNSYLPFGSTTDLLPYSRRCTVIHFEGCPVEESRKLLLASCTYAVSNRILVDLFAPYSVLVKSDSLTHLQTLVRYHLIFPSVPRRRYRQFIGSCLLGD